MDVIEFPAALAEQCKSLGIDEIKITAAEPYDDHEGRFSRSYWSVQCDKSATADLVDAIKAWASESIDSDCTLLLNDAVAMYGRRREWYLAII